MWYNPLIYREIMAEDFDCPPLMRKKGPVNSGGACFVLPRRKGSDGKGPVNESATGVAGF